MARSIYASLIKHELSINGIYKGIQRCLSEFDGYTVPYIPCQAQRLNTFLEHSCKASYIIINFIDFSVQTIRSETENMDNLINNAKITVRSFGVSSETDIIRYHQARKLPK